jgi:hypothetical protein
VTDIKCEKWNKVYRGQDFFARYCSVCPNIKEATVTEDVITCPHLKYYQSYKPKRKKPWEQGKPGMQATIPRGGY